MNLASEYARQQRWRDWPTVLAALPSLEGKTILDLGCGAGDVAAVFVARGARVIGFDANEELIRAAQARGLPGAEFRVGDLRADLPVAAPVDGLWCSFTAAYFPDLAGALERWSGHLLPGAWAAITEVDELFGHEPLERRTQDVLRAYAEDALAAGRYDFCMGRKLVDHVRRAGLTLDAHRTLADQELAFGGPAAPEVLESWRQRFARMSLLRRFCAEEMPQVEAAFLGCLARQDHVSRASVHCCIASKVAPRAPSSGAG